MLNICNLHVVKSVELLMTPGYGKMACQGRGGGGGEVGEWSGLVYLVCAPPF